MKKKLEFDICEKMIVPMKADQELKVAERAEELALEFGFDQIRCDEIKLALIEAVINAIEHGKSAEGKIHVTFGLSKDPRRITIVIGDSGTGFDPGSVQNPDIKEKMHKKARKRGWGLKLMRSMMDDVRVKSSRSGTQVTLVKNG